MKRREVFHLIKFHPSFISYFTLIPLSKSISRRVPGHRILDVRRTPTPRHYSRRGRIAPPQEFPASLTTFSVPKTESWCTPRSSSEEDNRNPVPRFLSLRATVSRPFSSYLRGSEFNGIRGGMEGGGLFFQVALLELRSGSALRDSFTGIA